MSFEITESVRFIIYIFFNFSKDLGLKIALSLKNDQECIFKTLKTDNKAEHRLMLDYIIKPVNCVSKIKCHYS